MELILFGAALSMILFKDWILENNSSMELQVFQLVMLFNICGVLLMIGSALNKKGDK